MLSHLGNRVLLIAAGAVYEARIAREGILVQTCIDQVSCQPRFIESFLTKRTLYFEVSLDMTGEFVLTHAHVTDGTAGARGGLGLF